MSFKPTSQEQVAEFFGKSVDTVKLWRKKGMPGEPGNYDIGDIVRWLRVRIAGWENYLPGDFLKPSDPGSYEASVRVNIEIENSIRGAMKGMKINGKAISKKLVDEKVMQAVVNRIHSITDDPIKALKGHYHTHTLPAMKAERERLKQLSFSEKATSK